MRAPKHCGRHPCTNIVPAGTRYCDEHRSGWSNSARTASSSRTGTTKWKTLRLKILARDGYQCQIRYDGCIGQATIADHVLALLLVGTDDPTNLQAACRPCSDKKASDEGHIAQGHTPKPR
jgi:5-methylcytosine-specific restriction protein A